MMKACRRQLDRVVSDSKAAHPGLLLDRYLTVAIPDDVEGKAKQQLYGTATRSAADGARKVYASAFQRRYEYFASLAKHQRNSVIVQEFTLSTAMDSRLIVGLGCESPLETGLTLHRTYGVPIIPGSALKGLASHYCDQALGEMDPRLKQGHRDVVVDDSQGTNESSLGPHGVIFGEGGGDLDAAGHLTFHEAWLRPDSLKSEESGFRLDVMTPHHQQYYSLERYKNGEHAGQQIPPTDFDDPVPVSFLSVTGSFHFVLTCDDPNAKTWLDFAVQLLKKALIDWGVGGKTSSGYGRFCELDLARQRERIDRLQMDAISNESEATFSNRNVLPNPWDLVEAEIISKTEKRGKLKYHAKHLDSGISGPVENAAEIPSDVEQGSQLELFVTRANQKEMAFKFPSDAAKKQAEQAKAKKTGGRSKG